LFFTSFLKSFGFNTFKKSIRFCFVLFFYSICVLSALYILSHEQGINNIFNTAMGGTYSILLCMCVIILLSSYYIYILMQSNPLYLLFALIACILSTILLLFFFGSEILSLLFLLIYIGAIAILFLFVIMLFDIKKAPIYS